MEVETLKHDLKNELTYIYGLLDINQIEDVKRWIQMKTKVVNRVNMFVLTNCDAFNLIVNEKLTKAKELGVETKCMIENDLENIIPNEDMISLMGNIFDNAIEACSQLEHEKYIELSVRKVQGFLQVSMKNSIHGSVLKKNPRLETTKENKKEHGIGIKRIRQMVKTYEGNFDCYEEQEWLMVNIHLKLSGQ